METRPFLLILLALHAECSRQGSDSHSRQLGVKTQSDSDEIASDANPRPTTRPPVRKPKPGRVKQNWRITSEPMRDQNYREGPLNTTSHTEGSNMIMNGVEAIRGRQPWLASLQVYWDGEWYHVCGGALVNTNKVLTSAHCFVDLRYNDGYLPMRAGINWHDLDLGTRNVNSQTYDVIDVKIHPGYQSHPSAIGQSQLNDLAVVTLSKHVRLNRGITLAVMAGEDQDFTDAHCNLNGWGGTESGMPSILHEAWKTVLTPEDCSTMWKVLDIVVADTEICSIDWTDQGAACGGDSGGPLVCEGWLVGVVSWGMENCSGCFPTVYTRISKYARWIKATTGKSLYLRNNRQIRRTN